MKFSITTVSYIPEVASKSEETSVLALVGVQGGVYAVDFGRYNVSFFKGKDFMEALENCEPYHAVDLGNVYHTPEFTQRSLKMKEGFNKVKCYPCGTVTVFGPKKNRELSMEYLDTTRGKIPEHNHDEKCIEVYLSAEAPYRGEFCGVGETHKPFCDKTVAVKMHLE